MPSRTANYAFAGIAGLTLAVGLAGCSASTDTSAGTADGVKGPYTDGTYTATGGYVSPNGPETIDVSITLKDDVITAVEVIPNPDNANTEKYQGLFAAGISDVVVGKDIDAISVSKVSGSSLTSGGFNEAVAEIKADAKA
jgi:uncharacterized protein with FMN-binding domain